jgi:periplasmic divalent cation tolerance protein
MKPYLVYVTTADKAEARRIGEHLVRTRLAACVNILDGMNSIYMWEDKLQDDQETVLIAKTVAFKLTALTETIKKMHSYDCPCVVALPIEGGNTDFLGWIAAEVGGE